MNTLQPFELPPRDFAALEMIIAERLEESTRLELKSKIPPSGQNDDVARSIASMANTQGGAIIYSIDEDDTGRAARLVPFPVEKSAERLALIAQSLDGPVVLSEAYSIPDSNPLLGYLVVVVPRSNRGPHLFRGEAWGRSPKGDYRLTRREVGELFALSEGFAQEFNLVLASLRGSRFDR